MCLLVLAWDAHPKYRLVVAANRDEYHDRPAAPLAPWPVPSDILAGTDLRAGGTWLGIDRQRRLGIVTNFRDPEAVPVTVPGGRPPGPRILRGRSPPESARSRGHLIPRYLGGATGPGGYLAALEPDAGIYGGFNLLLADAESLWYGSNRSAPFARALSRGVHGLSNELLDTPWPKLRRVRRGFEDWLSGGGDAQDGELFKLLADRTPATDAEVLPSTGLSPEWERILSSPFVRHERYGTRCSTIVAIEPTGACFIAERRFDPSGACLAESEYRLAPLEWPSPKAIE
ncbi:MAG: NRDE family protein [Gammaproteobacteria bacterium]|nr:NRDE family protein [Gammaproteobacteria bacterium]MDE2261088.1 NRDE family protein [Gammaproteobacteria bacterium]